MRPTAGLFLLAGVAAANPQRPFSALFPWGAGTDEYQFDWPIRRVAVIGAGPCGMIAYRELAEAGLEVRIFERDTVPGGNWHYTEEVPLDAPVPNAPVMIGDFVPSFPPPGVDFPYSEEFEGGDEIWRGHRAPRPLWESLTSNMPSPLQQFSQWPWPVGTQWELSHFQIRNYIRSYASYLHINSNDENPAITYNTRVEHVEKRINDAGQEQGWRLWLTSLKRTHSGTYQMTWWTEDFDAVVAAVGKYNAPFMPTIPGLEEWVRRFPDLIRHSRQYRHPEAYTNQTVLIIGASTSGVEISRDLNRHVRKIYQSFRPHNDNQTQFGLESKLRRIPGNTTLVGEVNRFLPIPKGAPIQSGLVELKNGTVLSGIDSMIMATGFRLSYPFLSQYYDGATYEPHAGSATTVSPFIPDNGLYVRDMYLDQFYIRDPTLAFVGYVPSYPSLDYTSLALAKVWTNKAKLPSSQGMWTWYNKTLEERGGYGKYFLDLRGGRTEDRITYLIGWLNQAAVKYGGKQVDAAPKYAAEVAHYWRIAHFGAPVQVEIPRQDEAILASFGIVPNNDVDPGWYDDSVFYYDDW